MLSARLRSPRAPTYSPRVLQAKVKQLQSWVFLIVAAVFLMIAVASWWFYKNYGSKSRLTNTTTSTTLRCPSTTTVIQTPPIGGGTARLGPVGPVTQPLPQHLTQVGLPIIQRIESVPRPPIQTTASPDVPQQVGVLVSQNQDDPMIMPLYGRPKRRNDRFEYYTMSDRFHAMKLPIRNKGRDCVSDDTGCEEIYDKDIIEVPAYKSHAFEAQIYKREFYWPTYA